MPSHSPPSTPSPAILRLDNQVCFALYSASLAMTTLLKRLEAQGQIARLRDVQDERRVRITLTSQGRALRDQAEAIPQCVLQSSQCSIAELTALTTELKQLRDRLSEQR